MLEVDARVLFTFMAAPRFFRDGANRVQVFLVRGSGKYRRLEPFAGT